MDLIGKIIAKMNIAELIELLHRITDEIQSRLMQM